MNTTRAKYPITHRGIKGAAATKAAVPFSFHRMPAVTCDSWHVTRVTSDELIAKAVVNDNMPALKRHVPPISRDAGTVAAALLLADRAYTDQAGLARLTVVNENIMAKDAIGIALYKIAGYAFKRHVPPIGRDAGIVASAVCLLAAKF